MKKRQAISRISRVVAQFAWTCLFLAILNGACASSACADPRPTLLPYGTRDKNYSGWTASVQADTHTTGMSGATVALPSSISAAEANPAGFAMGTGSVSAQINKISLTDKRLQPSGQAIESGQWGLGVSPAPWGYSIAYYSSFTESGAYVSPRSGRTLESEVSMKELRFTVARSFFDSHLAIGVSGELVKAVRELGAASYNAYSPSYRLGALYRLPNHLFLGASYAPKLTIGPTDDPDTPDLPGFNRAVVRPSQLAVGAGWVPNRFFKAGVSLAQVGATGGTALLSDQSLATGEALIWIPRLGASYVLAEYTNLKVELAAGSYYAMSRIQGQPSRLHATSSFEVNPYFINLGVGFDLSSDYSNVMMGVGLDIVRTLRTFDIIPDDPVPAYGGIFPRMTEMSAEGLPDPMTKGEPREHPSTRVKDVEKIVREAPQNVIRKFQGKPTTVEKRKRKRKKGK